MDVDIDVDVEVDVDIDSYFGCLGSLKGRPRDPLKRFQVPFWVM